MQVIEKPATDFHRLFDEAQAAAPDKGPVWLAPLRRSALARFEALGFPTIRQEAWRHTDLGSLSAARFVPAPAAQASVKDFHFLDFPGAGTRLVFVNGRFSPELSSRLPESGPVRFGSLAALLRKSPDLLQSRLGRVADPENDPFVSLNTAFLSDGAYVHVAASETPESVEVIFVSKPGAAPALSHPRVLLLADPGARAAVVEAYAGDGAYFTNAVTEVRLEEGAAVSHYRVQRESAEAFHISSLEAILARNARFNSFNVSLGGGLVRNNVRVLLSGEGAECRLNGLYLASGRQHVDNHTYIDHAAPRGTSRELYKGLLAGRARAVFNGDVAVRPGAQKTDSVQTNKNLLLSDSALVHTKPDLRIQANDVKCKHGAAVGQLNPDMLFYLRSRGIGASQARRLLAQAFAAEVTALMDNEFLREDVNRWVADWLPEE